jgi:hypothetical protein
VKPFETLAAASNRTVGCLPIVRRRIARALKRLRTRSFQRIDTRATRDIVASMVITSRSSR